MAGYTKRLDAFPLSAAVLGYSTAVLLVLVPLFGLALFDAPIHEQGTPPFVVFTLMVAVSLVVLRPIYLVVRLHPEPTKQLIRDARQHAPWLLASSLTMLLLAQTLDNAGSIKRIIPSVNPFWSDALLIEVDRSLFLGNDAWTITHAIIGPIGTQAIDWVYAIWHPVQIFFCTAVALIPDRRFQLQALLSYQLAWLILGNLLATVMASVGPCFVSIFFGRKDFLPLMAELQEKGAIRSARGFRYLLDNFGTDAIGAGISAMPSLHVGIAVLVALAVRQRFPNFQWLAWAFAGITYIGSIHLGWHYATDGIVSAVTVVGIWKLVSLYLNKLSAVRLRRRALGFTQ